MLLPTPDERWTLNRKHLNYAIRTANRISRRGEYKNQADYTQEGNLVLKEISKKIKVLNDYLTIAA